MNCNNIDCPPVQTNNWFFEFTEKYPRLKHDLPPIAYAFRKKWRPPMTRIKGGHWGAIYKCERCNWYRFKGGYEIALENETGQKPRRR